MDKNIHRLVTSELVVRTNNVKFRQEYGEVGSALNIREDGVTTVFTTVYGIDKVVYVTVNGVNLIEGKHYTVTSEFTITIGGGGVSAIKKIPGMTTNILVGYNYTKSVSALINLPTDPPVIDTFYLSATAGINQTLTFNFKILPKDGSNIFWSILKDGNEVPLYSGTDLETVNGTVTNGTVNLQTDITLEEYTERQGETIPFTLIVVYDLTEDGTRMDEKLLASAGYTLVNAAIITGTVVVTPETITIEGTHAARIDTNVQTNGSPSQYEWKLVRSRVGEVDFIVYSGDELSPTRFLNFDEVVTTGDSYTNTYSLEIKESTDLSYRTLAVDTIIVNVPAEVEVGNAGYIDVAVVNYEVSPGVFIKIGDLGTPQDAVEYTNRVSRLSLTKNIDISYLLTDQKFIDATVYTNSGAISQVHFVLEAPDSWGEIEFYQALGNVPLSEFNAISLGNGMTAYIYRAGASSVLNPTDFYIKPKV